MTMWGENGFACEKCIDGQDLWLIFEFAGKIHGPPPTGAPEILAAQFIRFLCVASFDRQTPCKALPATVCDSLYFLHKNVALSLA